MPSTLVSPDTLPAYSQLDTSSLSPLYLANACAAAHKVICSYLNYDPAVQVHTDEQGVVNLPRTGRDLGTTQLRLKHQPLLSSDPTQVFTTLSLTYSVGLPDQDVLTPYNAAYPSIKVRPMSGMTWIAWLGLGAVGGLGFQFGAGSNGGRPSTGATGYRATYTAGYAITAADAAAYPTALPVPEDMIQAAAWLVEIIVGQGNRIGLSSGAAITGLLQGFKNLEYEERYHPMDISKGQALALLAGSQQGVWARQLIDGYRRTTAEKVFLV